MCSAGDEEQRRHRRDRRSRDSLPSVASIMSGGPVVNHTRTPSGGGSSGSESVRAASNGIDSNGNPNANDNKNVTNYGNITAITGNISATLGNLVAGNRGNIHVEAEEVRGGKPRDVQKLEGSAATLARHAMETEGSANGVGGPRVGERGGGGDADDVGGRVGQLGYVFLRID